MGRISLASRIVKRLFIFLLAVGLAAAHGEVPGPAADRLVAAVRAALPKGWSVSCNKMEGSLTISRDQPVLLWHEAIPNAVTELPGKCLAAKPAPEPYQFVLGIAPKMNPADYRRLDAENAEHQKQQDALYQQLERMGVRTGMGYDAFLPQSDGQRAVVAQYKAAKDAHHRLPDFYFGDFSLDWRWNGPKYAQSGPQDETIRKECDRVREQVTQIFSKYDGADVKTRPAANQ
jgi:hypothetical protein